MEAGPVSNFDWQRNKNAETRRVLVEMVGDRSAFWGYIVRRTELYSSPVVAEKKQNALENQY